MAKSKLKEKAKVGKWTLLKKDGKKWNCICECGAIKDIYSNSLTSGASTSCGCYRRTLLSQNNPMFLDEVRAKVGNKVSAAYTDERKQAFIDRSKSKEVIEKRKQTNIERYGGPTPSSSKDVLRKMTETNLQKYGTVAPAQNSEVKQTTKEYFISTFGVDNPMKLQSFKDRVSASISKTKRAQGVELLSNGKTVIDECLRLGILPSTYRNWRKDFGQEYAEKRLYGVRPTKSGLESFLIARLSPLVAKGVSVEFWDKYVSGDIKYKADIKLSILDKTIWLDADGLYWHSEANKEDNKYHFNKAKTYMQNNETVLQFRENEIYDQFPIVLSIIENKLGLTPNKIGARKLTLKQVPSIEANEFLRKNHLMGEINGVRSVGLYRDNELLSLLSYKVKGSTLDISRFCNKIHTSISGSFSKLLSYIISMHKDIDIVENFVDYRYGNGHAAIKSGFVLESVHCSFQWTDNKKVYNRQKCKADSSRGLTERENAKLMGLYKIWDAGQAKFIKKVNQ